MVWLDSAQKFSGLVCQNYGSRVWLLNLAGEMHVGMPDYTQETHQEMRYQNVTFFFIYDDIVHVLQNTKKRKKHKQLSIATEESPIKFTSLLESTKCPQLPKAFAHVNLYHNGKFCIKCRDFNSTKRGPKSLYLTTTLAFNPRRKGGSKGAMGATPLPPQDAEVAFWSTAIILIQW